MGLYTHSMPNDRPLREALFHGVNIWWISPGATREGLHRKLLAGTPPVCKSGFVSHGRKQPGPACLWYLLTELSAFFRTAALPGQAICWPMARMPASLPLTLTKFYIIYHFIFTHSNNGISSRYLVQLTTSHMRFIISFWQSCCGSWNYITSNEFY